MASLINNGTFTFNPEELKDWQKVIHELTFNDKELQELHDIETGVKYNQQIVFAGRMGLMGKAVSGCTPNEVGGLTLTEKFWNPIREDFRLTHCSADVNAQDKLVNQMSKMNPDFYNIFEGSQNSVGAFLVERVLSAFKENLLRKAWFNDTAAADITGGGVLTNGTDADYFNTFDGLFKQIFAEVGTGDKNYVEIAKNAGVDYDGQVLASGDGIAILKAMYKAADSRLKGHADKKFYVTTSIWDAYLDDLEDVQNQGAGNTMITENGQVSLTYRGIPLEQMDFIDRTIEEYEDNGTTYFRPNRAILSIPSNLPIATLATEDWGSLEAFYDMVTKKNYIDGIYTIDAKHLEPYLTVAAY